MMIKEPKGFLESGEGLNHPIINANPKLRMVKVTSIEGVKK